MKQTKHPSIPPAAVVNTVQSIQSKLRRFAQHLAPPFVRIMELATGNWQTQLIYVAGKLELADLLKDGPRSVEELAKKTDTDTESLYRVMRTLASLEVFKETHPRTFETTTYGRTLEKDHPQSVLPLAKLVGEELWCGPWSNILHSVKTGEASFPHTFGKDFFGYMQENPDKWATFNSWMTRLSKLNCPIIAGSYPFSRYKKIIDVGGGQGALISHILERHPNVQGVLFDHPDVVKNADGLNDSVTSRCSIEGGDFFKSVPPGGDLYIMQQIIHDWNDELSTKILVNCRKAMKSNGRLLIVDAVIKPGNAVDINKFLDIQMLLLSGGCERTRKEFQSLLTGAGFALVKIHPTAAMHSIVEAKPV